MDNAFTIDEASEIADDDMIRKLLSDLFCWFGMENGIDFDATVDDLAVCSTREVSHEVGRGLGVGDNLVGSCEDEASERPVVESADGGFDGGMEMHEIRSMLDVEPGEVPRGSDAPDHERSEEKAGARNDMGRFVL